MKKLSKKIVVLTVALGIISAQNAFASWSNYGTFDVKNSETSITSSGNMLRGEKGMETSQFYVYSSAKTMTSTPEVRLVNSSGAIRSSFVGVPNTGTYYVGSNNTGTPGYGYYASVKPAWNQVGEDSIRLKHDPQ